MNGKDLFVGLGYIDTKYIEEAGTFQEKRSVRAWRRPMLTAAVIALTLMLVGCGVAYARGRFVNYFTRKSGEPLSQGQVDYITQNEQVIGERQVQNEWTVELRSAINDGTEATVILGVAAPEGVSLEQTVVDGICQDFFGFGNSGRMGGGVELVTASRGISVAQMGFSWEEDGDGLDNTKNFVLDLRPSREHSTVDPFSPEAEYHIHIENIVREYDDQEYRQSLLNGKYKGQDSVMFEPEEIERMWKRDILVEGTWDFTIRFDESAQEQELLNAPVAVRGHVIRREEHLLANLFDFGKNRDMVTITSFILRPLSADITYDCDGIVWFTENEEEHIDVVMKDGSQIELKETTGTSSSCRLNPVSPIVLADVDHVLMPDGTIIPMPE